MKKKTQDLTGPALDWAVCEALGHGRGDSYLKWWNAGGDKRFTHCAIMSAYSESWALAGPIIEEYNIMLDRGLDSRVAIIKNHTDEMDRFDTYVADGGDWLTAAMRCFVLSKLGEEVDVPEELMA